MINNILDIWTFEEVQDIISHHGLDLESEIAAALQHEIVVEQKLSQGWRKAEVHNVPARTVNKWIKSNFRGKYIGYDGVWVIENQDDYTAFVLRFS